MVNALIVWCPCAAMAGVRVFGAPHQTLDGQNGTAGLGRAGVSFPGLQSRNTPARGLGAHGAPTGLINTASVGSETITYLSRSKSMDVR